MCCHTAGGGDGLGGPFWWAFEEVPLAGEGGVAEQDGAEAAAEERG